MSNLKWADVAHYYQFSGIEIVMDGHPNTRLPFSGVSELGRGGKVGKYGNLSYENGSSVYTSVTIDQYIPILRHLEDMTEGEARELYTASYGKPWVEGKDTCAAYFRYKWKAYRTSLVGDYCNPKGIHWLITKGFDVFGLIESGQAIRKGVEGA